MNTALTATETVTVRPHPESTWREQIARRTRAARDAWHRRVEYRHSREYIAERHQWRLEAERLREERFRDAALVARVI